MSAGRESGSPSDASDDRADDHTTHSVTPSTADRGATGDGGVSSESAHGEFTAQVRATRADIERQVQATRAQLDATSERIRARTGRNLVPAIAIGLLFGALVLFSLIFVKALFLIVGIALAGSGSLELVLALRTAGYRVPLVPTVVVAVAIIPATYFGLARAQVGVLLGGIAIVVLWRLIEAAVARNKRAGLGHDLLAGVLIQLYVSLLASFSVLLVARPDGQFWLIAFMIVVVLVDVGAYVSGLLFGKHPMAPSVSPKKTWEGFAGAALVAIIAGVVLGIFMLGQPWWFGLIFGPVLLGSGTLGDLAESLIKRDIGVKDMSNWVPGHGGILDRLDSILPSAAVAYAFYLIFAHG